MPLHFLFARLLCSLQVISCSFVYLQLSLSPLPLVTDLWLLLWLHFCFIPTCYHLLLNFDLLLDYGFTWSQPATTCFWPLVCLLAMLLLDPCLLYLLLDPGLLTSWWGDPEDHKYLVLTCSKTHLHHRELWWISVRVSLCRPSGWPAFVLILLVD